MRFFLADLLGGNSVQNDIRFGVLEAFERENIAIPSTARAHDVKPAEKWPADDEQVEAQVAELEEARSKRAAQAAAGRKSGRPRKPDPE
jgi:potassium efflux system protein